MKLLLLFLAITSTALSAPRKPVETPKPAPEFPLPAKPEDAITKQDILDTLKHMQEIAHEQGAQLDAAKVEIVTLGKLHDAALVDLGGAKDETVKVQTILDGEREERIAAEKARDVEKKGRLTAEAHVRKIKNVLALALGGLFVALAQYLPFGLLTPPLSIYARIVASVGAFGLAWLVVARFV